MDNERFYANGDIRIRDTSKDLKPNPCPDCKKSYTVANSVSLNTDDNRVVWAGCIDCWVIRTSPEMCATFEEKK